MFKSMDAFQKFSMDQFAAATASVTALTNGMQQMLAETTELSKRTVETGTDAFQHLLATRTLDGALQVQMSFAKTALEGMVAGSSKLGSIVTTTTQDMVRPLETAFTRMGDATRTATTA
jgi:hypothetical protein